MEGDGDGDGRSLDEALAFDEEGVVAQARIPVPAIGIEDPERGPPAGWPGPAATDHDLGGLADHVPSQSNPGPSGEFQANARPLPDRGCHALHEPGRFEDEEADPRPAGQRGQPAQTIREACGTLGPGRQVQDQEINRPAGQERAGDRQALVRARRRDDHQPFGLDAAGHRLDRIERLGQIQPGDDGPAGLCLGGQPEGDRGPAARQVPAQRQAHSARQAAGQPARAEDRVEVRKTRREDPRSVRLPERARCRVRIRVGDGCERPDHLPDGARRGRSPARSQGRQGRRHVRGKGRHQVDYRTSVRMNQQGICGWPGVDRKAEPGGGPCYTLGPSSRPACCDAPVGM